MTRHLTSRSDLNRQVTAAVVSTSGVRPGSADEMDTGQNNVQANDANVFTHIRLTSSKKGALYFGYGSNLSTTQMLARCPSSATPVAIAKLHSYCWYICSAGYANVIAVTPAPTEQDTNANIVYGLVYQLTEADEKNLDGYEGWNEKKSGGVNPNPDERVWKPMLQGECSYNKLYLLVKVSKWLVDDEELRARKVEIERDSNSVGCDLVRTLVYVDEVRLAPGRIKQEYIGRMSRAVAECVPLGIPEDWVDQTMRQHGIIWWKSQPNKDASGEGAKVVQLRPPPRAQWELLRENYTRVE